MTLKSTRIYGIMGTNVSGKMARPRQMIGRDTPREIIACAILACFLHVVSYTPPPAGIIGLRVVGLLNCYEN